MDDSFGGELLHESAGYGGPDNTDILVGDGIGGGEVSISYHGNPEIIFKSARASNQVAREGAFTIESTDPSPIYFTDSTPANTLGYGEPVTVLNSEGKVNVEGNGTTEVTLTPTPNQSVGYGIPGIIQSDVFVDNAALIVNSAVGTAPLNAVLTGQTLSGVYSGTVHFSNLAGDFYVGLGFNSEVQLAVYLSAVTDSLTVQDTPAGVSTLLEANTVIVQETTGSLFVRAGGNVLVLGTNGALTVSGDEIVQIGNGTVQNIQGNVVAGGTSVMVDDGEDTATRNVSLDDSGPYNRDTLTGLAPAAISGNSLEILGSANSQYTIGDLTGIDELFAGAGSSVDVTPSNLEGHIGGLQVIGAAQVSIDDTLPPGNLGVTVLADPTRPNDPFNLTVDCSGQSPRGSIQPRQRRWWSRINHDGRRCEVSVRRRPPDTHGHPRRPDGRDYYHRHRCGWHHHQSLVNARADPGDDWPSTINQGLGQAVCLLGRNGNTQGLNGPVTVTVDPTQPPPLVVADDSKDTTGRTIVESSSGPGDVIFSGIAPAALEVAGGQANVAIKGGGGTNTLQGPNRSNSWQAHWRRQRHS